MSHSENQIEVGPTTSYYHGIEVGIQQERERIIALAKKRICFDHKNACEHGACYALSDLVALIKGEQK